MDPKETLKGALLAGARVVGGGRAGAPGALVLMYHAVGRAGVPYTVAADVFRAQMRFLKERGATFLTVHELGLALEARAVPRGAVCVTFDDAFVNAADALSWLLGQGGKATLFVVAAAPGYNHWDEDDGTIPRLRRMPWDQLRELVRAGAAIGSHTVNHPRLGGQDDAGLRHELFDSRKDLVERLQTPVNSLAYPHGDFDARVVRAAEGMGYQCAVTTQRSYAEPGCHPLLIPRFEPETMDELVDLADGKSHLFYRITGALHRARNRYLLSR